MGNIKQYRGNEMKWYVIAYLLIIVVLFTLPENGETITSIEKIFSSALISGVIGSLVVVFDSLYSSKLKEILLFMGFTKVPGNTIFTRIKNGKIKDDRISINDARAAYKEIIDNIPQNRLKGEYENSRWYTIYSKYIEDNRVQSTQHDFLLCRDLYITTISMAIITIVAVIMGFLPFSQVLFSYLLIMLVITNIAAHNKANRFVNTIIAIDLAAKNR